MVAKTQVFNRISETPVFVKIAEEALINHQHAGSATIILCRNSTFVHHALCDSMEVFREYRRSGLRKISLSHPAGEGKIYIREYRDLDGDEFQGFYFNKLTGFVMDPPYFKTREYESIMQLMALTGRGDTNLMFTYRDDIIRNTPFPLKEKSRS